MLACILQSTTDRSTLCSSLPETNIYEANIKRYSFSILPGARYGIRQVIKSKEEVRCNGAMLLQIKAVKFLVEKRGVEINQQDRSRGWTPLMRCAQMAHYTHEPYLQVSHSLPAHSAKKLLSCHAAFYLPLELSYCQSMQDAMSSFFLGIAPGNMMILQPAKIVLT